MNNFTGHFLTRVKDISRTGGFSLLSHIFINKILFFSLGFRSVCAFQKESTSQSADYVDPEFELICLNMDKMHILYQLGGSDISAQDKEYFDKCSGQVECYVSKLNGRITGYYFVNNHFFDVPEVNIKLNLSPDCFYIFKCFVFDQYRRHRIYTNSLVNITALKFKNGFKKSLVCASATNLPAIRANEKAGFKRIGKCWAIQKGPFRRTFSHFERGYLTFICPK